MIEMVISEKELRKALADLREAKRKGFGHSLAYFRLYQTNPHTGPRFEYSEDQGIYNDQLLVKADPVDGNQNWGRLSRMSLGWHKCVDGKCVPEDEGEFYKLRIKANDPETEIYIATPAEEDEDGLSHLVERHTGEADTSLRPGTYLIHFGIRGAPRRIDLCENKEMLE